MARARKGSRGKTGLNWWIRNTFSRRSDGRLCRKLKRLKRTARAVPEKQFSLPIKIDMAPWAPLRWTKMEIWPQQLQPAAPQISDRAESSTRRSSARELTATLRHAPFLQRTTVNIFF